MRVGMAIERPKKGQVDTGRRPNRGRTANDFGSVIGYANFHRATPLTRPALASMGVSGIEEETENGKHIN